MSKYRPLIGLKILGLSLTVQFLSQIPVMALECGNSRSQGTVYGSMEEAAEAACVHQSGSTGVMEVDYLSESIAIVRCESCRSDGSCEPWMGWTASCRATEFYADYSDPDIEDQTNGKSCPSSNNPINLISGNKYKIHTDIKHHLSEALMTRPGFTRIYNSQVFNHTDNIIGKNWRHSYQRSLHTQDSFNSGVNQRELTGGASYKVTESSVYSSEYAACVEGFQEYKDRMDESGAVKDILQQGTVRWEMQACRVYIGGRYIATIPIRSHDSGSSGEVQSPVAIHAIRLNRENGRVYHFVKDYVNQGSTLWKSSDPDLKHHLEQVVLDDLSEDEINSPYFQAMRVSSQFRFTDENNVVETYNNDGELISIEYPNGIRETLIYESVDHNDGVSRRLVKVVNNFGKYVEFNYNGDKRITSVADDTGRAWSYTYNLNGNLIRADNPDDTSKQYLYENIDYPNLLTGEIDERGIRYSTFSYQTDGRAFVSYLGAPGIALDNQIGRVEVSYGGGRNNAVTDSLGNITRYHFPRESIHGRIVKIDGPDCHYCSTPDAVYEYSADYKEWEFYPSPVYLLSKNEFGTGTEYAEYDDKGNPGLITEAVGSEQERQKRLTYDSRYQGLVETVTEPSVYSPGEKVTTYTYDDHENITSIRIEGFDTEGSPVRREYSMQYNGPFNQISQFDGPREDISDITYFDYYPDEAGQGNNRARLRSVRAHNGWYLRDNIRYTGTGNIASENRLNGLQVAYSYYSDSDRLNTVQMTDSLTGQVRSIHYTYLATGEVKSITHAYNSSNPVTLEFGYDNARRLTTVIDAQGNYIEYELDTEGNIVGENIYDNGGILKKSLSQTFDSYNRLKTSVQMNENRTVNFNPDGTVGSVIDGNGVSAEFDYDSLKRLVKIMQDAGGQNPYTSNTITQYIYDSQDNLVSVVAANNAETRYKYDDLGNLISLTSPDTGTILYDNDAAGNIVRMVDAKNQVFNYTYDAFNRLVQIETEDLRDNVYYTYDNCAHGQGLVCGVQRDNSTLNYKYNAFSDVTEISQSLTTVDGFNTAENTVAYTYNANGDISSIAYPSGVVVNYSYNGAGKVDNVYLEQDGQVRTLSLNISYLPFGEESIQTYGNGINVMGFYDTAYRPFITGDPDNFFEHVSAYDGNGNITGLTTLFDNNYMMSQFEYDRLNRISSASGFHGGSGYYYDKVGNKQLQAESSSFFAARYYAQSNRLNTLGGEDINIDENGNLLNLRGMALSYTTDNRLKSVNTDVRFEYNGLGQRVMKRSAASGVAGTYGYVKTTGFIYGASAQLLAEVGPTGRVTKEYIYLNDTPLAMLMHSPSSPDAIYKADLDSDGEISSEDAFIWYFNYRTDPAHDVTGDGVTDNQDISMVLTCGLSQTVCATESYSTEIYYIHNDHLGTPKLLTDNNQNVVWRARSTPFGKAFVDNDVDGDGVEIEFNLRQPGQYYDRESGLYYNYYRYYDPETGRYITSDPIGLRGGINTYAYVENNPLKYIDPLGLWALSLEGYLVLGGGINMSYSEGTFEMTGRIGIGLGGGFSYDPNGTPSPHSESCGSGYIARTSFNANATVGWPLGIGASYTGATGNAFTDNQGGGYHSVSPHWGTDRSGNNTAFRFGASYSVEIGSYSNW